MSLFSALGKMALALLAMIGVGVVSCEVNKAYWDRQVRELCELDGGVVVYERVELTPEEYRENDGYLGEIYIPTENSQGSEKYSFFQRTTLTSIKKAFPAVRRFESVIYRRSDKTEIGRYVSYTRSGGDFPTGVSESSTFSCADIEPKQTKISDQIFSVKGE